MSDKKSSVWKSSQDIISGIVGGVALVIAGHPFDTIKVRMQTMPAPPPGQAPQFTGALDCFYKTLKFEGVRGLYKGMLSPITGVPPIYAIVFGAYGGSKRWLQKTPEEVLSLTNIFIAGCITGVATTIITSPVELVKSRLQIQYNNATPGAPVFKGPGDMAKHILKTEGVNGLFRGTAATLWRDVPGSGIYFAVYEAFKRYFDAQKSESQLVRKSQTLFAGGMAGVGIWVIMFPVDFVKSRVQVAEAGRYVPGTRGMIQCAREVVRESGVKAMYKGFGPCLLRSFPANAACFLAVDFTNELLNKL